MSTKKIILIILFSLVALFSFFALIGIVSFFTGPTAP
ncbi:BH3185 [Halalkalibacterium halodurans C-125]|uniref:BH3185 protein n=1 Tax=Halalkalibacterium halodurans (strain ATCC BAA-125 / DSM 18197 / FERM 7344 / JCM 9153 / C-125) TaxID=272558 RepID=Q9K822_HALH5|nr:BH3185 [Halalkalibacterium halodurans C-125]